MIDIKIDIADKTYNLTHPSLLNDLTKAQFTEIVKYIYSSEKNTLNNEETKIKLLFVLLGGLSCSKKKRKETYKITDAVVNSELAEDLFALQNFITKEQDFNNWLIPSIKIGKNTSYYGPDNRFSSMKFGEFISVDMLISAYFGSKKPAAILDKIVAVLYREERNDIPNNFTGDRRTLLDSDLISHREKIVKNLDETTKKAILYNYIGVRNWLSKKYSLVFSSPDTSKRMNITLGKKENNWLSIRRHLAGNVITKLKEVDITNLHDVLSSLNEEMKKD